MRPNHKGTHKGFELFRNEELLEFAKFFLCHDNLNLSWLFICLINWFSLFFILYTLDILGLSPLLRPK
jgi:hypothetical protein